MKALVCSFIAILCVSCATRSQVDVTALPEEGASATDSPSCRTQEEWNHCHLKMKELSFQDKLAEFEIYFNSMCVNKMVRCQKVEVPKQGATAKMLSLRKDKGSAYQLAHGDKVLLFIVNPAGK